MDGYLVSKRAAICSSFYLFRGVFKIAICFMEGRLFSLHFISLASKSYTRASVHRQIEIELNYKQRVYSNSWAFMLL